MSSSPSSPAKKDKTMSSRLLTMKFMQRAAASAAASEPQTSEPDDDTHTPKRQRLSTEPDSPQTPQSDLDAIAAALKVEEQKRRDAVMRQAAEAGESEWVLDVPAANVPPSQPYAVAADSLDAEDDPNVGGRRGFGGFKPKRAKTYTPTADAEESEEEHLPIPSDPEQRKAFLERRNAKAAAKKLEERRRNAPVNLNHLKSISGSGGQGNRRESGGPSNKNKKKRKSS